MNLYDVIKKPVITESSMAQLEAGKYVFEVDTRAHKLLIKQAVEAAFEGVKVANVNTINVKPKAKRVGRYTGFTNKLKKLSSHLQLILKQSSCLLLKLNNLRRKYRGNSCL
ncbi:50S ribosomal L23 domain protein [Streptococcus pneumoniae GA47368]|nr:50S ribosomal L23 domain protein [Streptococcus pneumoniae GA47368]EHE54451.1 50S ribosomal L23 domain protein [Streptococcus pneumoniae Netherlands15B-37]